MEEERATGGKSEMHIVQLVLHRILRRLYTINLAAFTHRNITVSSLSKPQQITELWK